MRGPIDNLMAVASAQVRSRRRHWHHFTGLLALACAIVLSFALSRPAWAADVPWPTAPVDIATVDGGEPLSTFLLRFLSQVRIRGTVGELVGKTSINGRFRNRPEVIFNELAATYGLSWYFDGDTLHVYSQGESRTEVFWLEPADIARLEPLLRQMRIADARFPLRIVPSEGYVMVSGPPRYVALVERSIAFLQEAPGRRTPGVATRVFRIKHASADDRTVTAGGVQTVVPGIATLLNQVLGDQSAVGAAPRSRATPLNSTSLLGRGLVSVGKDREAGRDARAPPTGAAGAAGAAGGDAARQSPPDESGAAPTRRFGSLPLGAVAIANPQLNAVIVRDAPEKMPIYDDLVRQLDVPSPLIEVEVTIIDVSSDKADEFGVDWRLRGSRLDVLSSPGRNADADYLRFADGPTSSGQGLIGTILAGSDKLSFVARVSALEQSGDATVTSRPRIVTIENQEAVLTSTREFYISVTGREVVDLFNVTTGLVVRATPSVVDAATGQLRLAIRIEDGNPVPGARPTDPPEVTRNVIATQATVGEGQSLLIGGYRIDERRDRNYGVTGLSRLPIVGRLFGTKNSSLRRVERLYLITPRLESRRAAF
jgi:type III secretion protein C